MEQQGQKKINAVQTVQYDPNLYHYDKVAEGISGGFEAVTDEHVQQFHEQGYLVINDGFSQEEIQQALAGMAYLMDGKHPDFRGVQFEPGLGVRKSELVGEERRGAIRKLMSYVKYESRLNAMASHPGLIAVLTRLIGETPVLFQDMALCKPPRVGSEKPWHQDCAYFNIPLGTTVAAVWIALDEATAENGCMHVIPGSHKTPTVHFKRRDWQICDTDVAADRDVMVPLKPGGCLFWHGLTHHGTPANLSDKGRRALQLHYKPEHHEDITTQERMEIYGSEGKDVEC
ncbi:phytanoyl-CoA dioxygenase family protein [Candidatus Poribacteria bacterium]|nr:phytanoyl-CoA dioxygenase family protein [Candidatus Poribacteria bacterium]